MIIGLAGPYSAPFEAQRQADLDAMNAAAARLLEMGHVPVIGACDALLLIGESPGANMERDLIRAKGRPVFTHIEDVPKLPMDKEENA